MFSGRWETTIGEDGCIFIDKDPFVFRHILNYLRGEKIPFDKLSEEELERLKDDADYYQLDKKKLFGENEMLLGKDFEWLPNQYFQLSDNNKTATRTTSSEYRLIVASKPLQKGSKFSIKMITSTNCHIFVGVAPKGIDCSSPGRYGQNGGGWYLYCYNGSLYSATAGKTGQSFHGSKIPVGSVIISVELTQDGKLKYYLNDRMIGGKEAYDGINEEVFPAVEISNANDVTQFV
jgi:hypothetical protein